MAWTAPVTWTPNSILTAAQLNAQLRDNILQTFPALATTDSMFPVSTGLNTMAARTVDHASVTTSQTTTSTTYADLTTVGPTVSIVTGTQALVFWSASVSNSLANVGSRMSIGVTGASAIVAADTYALHATDGGAGNNQHLCMSATIFGLTAGTNVFTGKYRVNSASTGTFQWREVIVVAF